MPDLSPDQAIQALRGLPEDRQRAILAKLSPEVKQGIMGKLTAGAPSTPAAPTAPQPEDRTFGNYASEAISGVGRGIMNDVTGVAQTVMHPIDTVVGLRNQAQKSVTAAQKEYAGTEGTQGQKLAAGALGLLENAPLIGGMVQHAEQGGEQMGSPEGVGAAAEGITTFAAPEALAKGIGVVSKALPDIPGKVVRGVTGTGPRTVRDLVKETTEQNTKIGSANEALGKQHLEQTQNALHESEGRELQYRQAVKSAQDTAQERQADLDQEHSKAVQDALHQNAGKELAYQQELSKAKLESEDAYQSKLAEVEAKRAKARQDYRSDLFDYAKKKAKLQSDYQDAVDKASSETQQQSKIAPTAGKLKQAYSDLRAGIETARENALRIGNSKYSAVNSSLSSLPADMETVHGLYSDASDSLGETQAVPSLLNRLGKSLEKGEQLTYADEQALYSELGKELSKGTLPGNLYHAYDQMHEGIGQDMQRLADSKGMGAQLMQARNYWRRMKQTFGKPYGATDAATKTLRDASGNLVSADEQTNRVRLLGSFDNRLPGLFQHVENLTTGAEALPKAKPARTTLASLIEARKVAPSLPAKPGEIPNPEPVTPRSVQQPLRTEIPDRPKQVQPNLPSQPERVPIPDRPEYAPAKKISLADIKAAKAKGLERAANTVSHRGMWAAAYPVFSALRSIWSGGIPNPLSVGVESAGIAGTVALVARAMRSPKVVEFLTKATPEDVAQIPPEMRGTFPQILAQAQKRGIKVSPALIRAFTAAAATGTDQRAPANP